MAISRRNRVVPTAAASSGMQHLQGDQSTVSGILRQIHGCHAPATELPLDPVSVSQDLL